MKTTIVGLIGHMHAGKDMVGEHLVEKHSFERAAFADHMKRIVHMLDLPQTRHSYQTLGSGMRSLFNEDVWVTPLDYLIRNNRPGKRWVITDVRYQNEIDWIKKWGGTLIGLDVPTAERWERFKTSSKFDPRKSKEKWLEEQMHETERHTSIVLRSPNHFGVHVIDGRLSKAQVRAKVTHQLWHLGVLNDADL